MIKLFISSLALSTTLAHPHPGWIYVGTPAPIIPGTVPGTIITDPTNPNYIPPMTHPNGLPFGTPSNPVPPAPILPIAPNTTPGSKGAAQASTTPQPATNLIPVQPIMPPPGAASTVPPVTTAAAAATTNPPITTATPPASVPNTGSGITPPVTFPQSTAPITPIAPVAQATTLAPGVNTISTTTAPVPGIGIVPPTIGTTKAATTTAAPVAVPGSTSAATSGPAIIASTAPIAPVTTAAASTASTTASAAPGTGTGTGTGTGSGPSIVPPPWIANTGTPQGPLLPLPGAPIPGLGTPQPTPFPTARPTTPAPVMPTLQPTTAAPTTPAPVTPAPVFPLPGHQFGAFGQNCPDPLGNEQCVVTSAIVTDQTGNNAVPGQVTCNAPNDCCLCNSIQCGEVGGQSCTALTLSGQKAAYGVKDINVVVDPLSGTPASITCSGLESCKEAAIRGNFVNAVRCIGRFGCQQSEIIINNPAPGFALECGVTSACENAKITINFLAPAGGTCGTAPTDILLGAISCIGVNGCRGMELTINNMGCDNVILETIECRLDTCADAQFNFYGTSAIGVQACELPATGAQPRGIERCFSQLRSLSCPDPGSCMNQQRTLTDPINGFMLSCESEMSCMNAQYAIQITPAIFATQTEQITVQCNAAQSCQNAQFDFINENQTPLYVEAFCTAEAACAGATFTTGPNVFLFEIECGAPELCYGCTLNGLPCGGHSAGFMPPNFPPLTIPNNVPPNPNPNFPTFPQNPVPVFPSNPVPVFPANPLPVFPTNPAPVFPTNPVGPVFPSVPSPPLPDPWAAQPNNPWAGPTFTNNPNPNPLPPINNNPFPMPMPFPPFSSVPNPNPNPLPPINANPVTVPTVPSPPNQPSIPTFNQPVAPAPPQPQPAPIDPWAQPNPWASPQPQPQPIDPWASNPFFSPNPWYSNQPINPGQQQGGNTGPSFSFGQPPAFPQNPGPWI